MIKKVIRIQNKHGLHARPCSLFVKAASQFRSEVKLQKDELEVNGKSIMGVMMLAAEYNSNVLLVVDGVDEEEATETLEDLFLTKFGEE